MMGFDNEYVEQFKTMTPEQIENHIGWGKVKHAMEGYPIDFGIDRIRKLEKKTQGKNK